jgi:phenylacetate-CoA ligase
MVARLRALAAHAVAETPYYRELFGESGLDPAGLRTLDDLGQLRISTRQQLREAFPERVVAASVPAAQRLPRRTSGSTGTPFSFFVDRADLDSWVGSHLFFFGDWAGAKVWHNQLLIAGGAGWSLREVGLPTPLTWARRRFRLGQRERLNALEVTTAELAASVRALGPQPYFIWAYPSAMTRLAGRLLAEGRELSTDPRVVICSGEALTTANAAIIGQVLKCPVVNYYTAWEMTSLAQSCPDQPELLHVNSERAIVRLVRADGRSAAVGEPGRVIVTNLQNRVMPFLNYELGDWATASGPCPCGRGFPTLSRLEGRLGEALRTPDGRVIGPSALCNWLTGRFPVHGKVAEFQAVQPALDRIVLRVVTTPDFSAEFAAELRRQFGELVGSSVRSELETVSEIEHEASGKRLLIKSELGDQQS